MLWAQMREPASITDPAVWLPSVVAIVVVVMGVAGQWLFQRRQMRHDRVRFLMEQRRSLYVDYLTAAARARWACSQAATTLTMFGGERSEYYDVVSQQLRDAWTELQRLDFDVEIVGSDAFHQVASDLTSELIMFMAQGIARNTDAAAEWLDSAHEPMETARIQLTRIARAELLSGR
jgi:hypothetical protein